MNPPPASGGRHKPQAGRSTRHPAQPSGGSAGAGASPVKQPSTCCRRRHRWQHVRGGRLRPPARAGRLLAGACGGGGRRALAAGCPPTCAPRPSPPQHFRLRPHQPRSPLLTQAAASAGQRSSSRRPLLAGSSGSTPSPSLRLESVDPRSRILSEHLLQAGSD